jgi:hypothetical protein
VRLHVGRVQVRKRVDLLLAGIEVAEDPELGVEQLAGLTNGGLEPELAALADDGLGVHEHADDLLAAAHVPGEMEASKVVGRGEVGRGMGVNVTIGPVVRSSTSTEEDSRSCLQSEKRGKQLWHGIHESRMHAADVT